MIVSIIKCGDSASIKIPNSILEATHWEVDEQLEIKQEGHRIIIQPSTQTSYQLEDLLSKITPENIHSHINLGASE